MNEAELALTAAFGASLLTAGGSLGVTWLREHLRAKAEAKDVLAGAITEMLSRSVAVMMRAQAIGLQMRLRSGLKEGTDVTLGYRKPADVLEFHDWLAADFAPLNQAWSVIWARGDQEAVRLANQLLDTCGVLVGAAVTRSPATTLAARLTRFVFGEKQTPELEQDLARAVKDVAHAREQLAQYGRKVLGLGKVKLFGQEPQTGASENVAVIPGEIAGELEA